jgi:hypothetical protein
MLKTIAAAALAATIGGAMSAAPALAQAAAPAQADIAPLSTVFSNTQSLTGWRQLEIPGFPAKWHAPRVEGGHLVLQPHSSGWFEDMMGGHIYRQIDGNFVVTARLRVEGTRAQLPQTLFTLAGLFIRAPREGLTAANWQPGRENWMFFAAGSAFPAGSPQFEIKTTYNSLSTLKIGDASAVFAGGQNRWVELRIARQGELFSLLYRVEGSREFTLHEQFIRPDLPARLNVGLTAYADWASVADIYPDFVRLNTMEPARNADLIARVERIDFRRPTVDRFPVASFDVRTSFMPQVSQARIDDLIRN